MGPALTHRPAGPGVVRVTARHCDDQGVTIPVFGGNPLPGLGQVEWSRWWHRGRTLLPSPQLRCWVTRHPGPCCAFGGSVSPRGGGEPRVPSRTIRTTPEGWDRAVVGYRGGRRSGPSRALCRHWSPAWGWGRAGEGRQGGNRQLSLLCWSGLGVPEVRFPRPSSSCATAALAAALRPALGLPCRPGQEGWGRPWAPAWSLIPPTPPGDNPHPRRVVGKSGRGPVSWVGCPTQPSGSPGAPQCGAGSSANTRLPPRHTALCGLRLSRLGRPASGANWEPRTQPSRSFLNLTNKRKEYSERRIIG